MVAPPYSIQRATMEEEVMATIKTKPPGTGTGKITIPGKNGL